MADVALVTGSAGLIGSQAVEFFSLKGFKVVGIDNDMRAYFFGEDGSTSWNRKRLEQNPAYSHYDIDIRNLNQLKSIFDEFKFSYPEKQEVCGHLGGWHKPYQLLFIFQTLLVCDRGI